MQQVPTHRPGSTWTSGSEFFERSLKEWRTICDVARRELKAEPRKKRFILLLFAICPLLLSGCGGIVVAADTSASLTINSQAVSFGDVAPNTAATQSIVLVSTGSAPVTITGSKVSGAGFSISGLVTPMTLTPGQSVTVSIQFSPTGSGKVAGQLTVTTNSKKTPVLQIGLSGGGNAVYQVNLTWNAPSGSGTPIAGYEVYKAASGNSQFQLLSESIVTPTSFIDPDVESGATYDYYVTTVDLQGAQSAPSNVAEVTVP